jgi:hypothetical protein
MKEEEPLSKEISASRSNMLVHLNAQDARKSMINAMHARRTRSFYILTLRALILVVRASSSQTTIAYNAKRILVASHVLQRINLCAYNVLLTTLWLMVAVKW